MNAARRSINDFFIPQPLIGRLSHTGVLCAPDQNRLHKKLKNSNKMCFLVIFACNGAKLT